MTIENKIAKLPVWARDHIENLERRLRETNALYVAVRDMNFAGSGRVQINCLPGSDRAINLRDHETVRFNTGDRWDHYVECSLHIDRFDGPGVVIRGGTGIEVMPRVTNSIFVRISHDRRTA